MEVASAAHLRHRLGSEREAEDQELEHVAAVHVARDELAGDVLRGDLLEDALRILARHGEVARDLVRVGTEAEVVLRAPHLARIEPAIAVGVHDRQLRWDTWPINDRQGQPHVRPARDERGRAVHLTGTPDADEAAGTEAGEQAVADHDHATETEDARAGIRGEHRAREKHHADRPPCGVATH